MPSNDAPPAVKHNLEWVVPFGFVLFSVVWLTAFLWIESSILETLDGILRFEAVKDTVFTLIAASVLFGVLRSHKREMQRTVAGISEREAYFRNALHSAPFPIFIHDENGELAFVNQAVLDITGYRRDQIRTMEDWTRLAYGKRASDVRAGIDALYAMEGRVREGEFAVSDALGDEHVWSFSSAPLGKNREGARQVISMADDITETRKSREIEERLAAILDHAPILVTFYSPEGERLWVSPGWEAVLGWTFEKAKSRDLLEDLYPDPEYRAKAAAFIKKAECRWGEFEAVRKDGTLANLLWMSIPMRDGSIIGIGMDLTERKRAERERLDSEKMYREILNSVSDAVFITLERGELIFVCPNAVNIFGYRAEEIYPMGNLAELIGDLRPFTEALGDRPELHNHERIIRDKAGEEHTLLINAKRVDIAGGTMLFTCRDITARKRTENELRASEERLRNALAASRDGIWEYNYATGYSYFSERMHQMLGYDPPSGEEGFGFFEPLIHPGDRDRMRRTYNEFLMRGDQPYTCEYRIKAANGEYRHVVSKGHCLERDGAGRAVRVIGTYSDVTEIKRLEEQLLQSQKMEAIGRLAGGVAHDFNNLIMVIHGYTDFALHKLPPGSEAEEDLREVIKAGERAASLTRQLLAFSRKQIFDLRVMDLNQLILDMDKMIRRLIGEDIEYVTLIHEPLWRVKADPAQIEQVLVNLAVNARDAMPDGGKLTIETGNAALDEEYAASHAEAEPGEYVMLAVSDTGCGMGEEIRERIFDPFFTTKEKSKGTGLGLSTVHGIVKQLGGNIYVYSEPGKGTSFKIYLPREESQGKVLESKALVRPPRGGETILVVEDEALVRNLIVRTLRSHGYTILEAQYGAEAVSICESHPEPIHLLLTDVIMPKMSGKELSEIVVNLRKDMKILFMSGYTDNAVVHHGILDEGINFIQKPITTNQLLNKVREVLDRENLEG